MHDAVFIGSGHNNLVAATLLARAGWDVLVLERAEDVGGAIRTDAESIPGYCFDAFSNTHALIFLSPFWRKMGEELGRHGLRYLRYPVNVASLFPDGGSVLMYPDPEATFDNLGRLSAGDADGWRKLFGLYREMRDTFSTLFSTPLPSLNSMAALAGPRLGLGARGNMEFMQMMTLTPRAFVNRYFSHDKAKAWLMPWALHLTHGPESAGGGFFTWLVLAVSQDPEAGMAVPEGGSGGLTRALAGLVQEYGGEVRTGAPVARVIVRNGTARGVRLDDGTEIEARRAVVAGTAPTRLFLELVGPEHLDGEFVGRVRRYRYGPPVVKIDYALERLPEWRAGEEARQAGLLHLTPGVDAMSLAYNQVIRGYLPEEPLLIVAQPTVIDPSRAPEGKHTLWVLARVPYEPRGDAAGKLSVRPWVHMKERFADRIADIIERYAPGFRETVLGRHIMSPEDMEEKNPNLVRGDVGTGSTEFDQSYVFRPFPGWSRYATPIRRLYLCSAGAHPGPGIHGMVGLALGNMLAR